MPLIFNPLSKLVLLIVACVALSSVHENWVFLKKLQMKLYVFYMQIYTFITTLKTVHIKILLLEYFI